VRLLGKLATYSRISPPDPVGYGRIVAIATFYTDSSSQRNPINNSRKRERRFLLLCVPAMAETGYTPVR
jgi:hypothetical protein